MAKRQNSTCHLRIFISVENPHCGIIAVCLCCAGAHKIIINSYSHKHGDRSRVREREEHIHTRVKWLVNCLSSI